MDALQTAIVDLTQLIATCHALRRPSPSEHAGEGDFRDRERRRLRAEFRRATTAYLKTLARREDGVFDDEALAACRVAAEEQMPRALAKARDLAALMNGETGSLGKLSAVRNDLWRLSHISIRLRQGVTALRHGNAGLDVQAADKAARRLQRHVRQALLSYALANLRSKKTSRGVAEARVAALARVDTRCLEDAESLTALESRIEGAQPLIGHGVYRALQDLGLDWPGEGTLPATTPLHS